MGTNHINVLSESVIGKIAAGEVVDRPASVIKELVENSIDAGATSIEIEIQSAGRNLIRVADDASGISSEDILVVCKRHTTSKIENENDLFNIKTLGFRGEALASIASVSQMDITSFDGIDESGFYLYLEGAEILKTRPAGRGRGTTIEVRNLFYNVPARRKFLKKDMTEMAEIVSVVGRFILSTSGIEIKLRQNEKVLIHAYKEMNLHDRIRLVLGADISDSVTEVSQEFKGCKVQGFISRPYHTRKDRNALTFFVNGRYVRSKTLSGAVIDSYRSMLERGKFPFCVLFLDIDPSTIDVNVHPTKMEIKFEDEKYIRNIITEIIENKFKKLKEEDTSIVEKKTEKEKNTPTAEFEETGTAIKEEQTEFSYSFKDNHKNVFSGNLRRGFLDENISENISQIGDCYIVQISDEKIVITDQHAAHERIFFETFSKASEERPVESQKLLFPIRLDLTGEESVVVSRTLEKFRVLGFEIEDFGKNSFIVHAAPAILEDRDIKTVVNEILNDLTTSKLTEIEIKDELIKIAACRAAIKQGDPLTQKEMLNLLKDLHRCDLPFTCPHGRPTTITFSLDDMEKIFRRK